MSFVDICFKQERVKLGMNNDLKIYTLDEAAEILKTTRRTLYTYIKNGDLKASKLGKRWLVTEDTIKELLESRENDPTKNKEQFN